MTFEEMSRRMMQDPETVLIYKRLLEQRFDTTHKKGTEHGNR